MWLALTTTTGRPSQVDENVELASPMNGAAPTVSPPYSTLIGRIFSPWGNRHRADVPENDTFTGPGSRQGTPISSSMGHAPNAGVEKWQDRIEPFQRRLAEGCHLTRDPVMMVLDAGFLMEDLVQRYGRGPKPWCYFTRAVAINAAE
jgi:hypothetical protein